MEVFLLILRRLLCASNTFLTLSATVLLLHCFYDTGFRWSRKKCIVLSVISLLDAVLLEYSPNIGLYANVSYIILTIAAIYDYQGKKPVAFIRFLLLFYIINTWSNWISRFGYCLIVPQDHSDFLVQFNWLKYDYIASVMSMGEQELWELIASTDWFPQVTVTITDSMLVFNYILNIIYFGFAFCYLYFRLYKPGVVIQCSKPVRVLAISYPILCNIVSMCCIFFGLRSVVTSTILSVLSILLALLFPLLVCNARISEYHRKRTAVQEQHIQAELAHFQQYRQMQEETSRFRHDIRNNLHCVNDLLQQGKTKEAAEYIHDLMGVVENMSKKYVTGDVLLDSIVGVKAQIMEQHGIRFELDGVLAGGLPWKPMDICNVFANALDNAIEACQKVAPEKRYISMNIKSTPQFWFVTIENPVTEVVDTSKLFQKNSGYTSKSDSTRHGIGTYSMKYTVESYGAMLKAECTDEIFKLAIMIDKSSPE